MVMVVGTGAVEEGVSVVVTSAVVAVVVEVAPAMVVVVPTDLKQLASRSWLC